MPSQVKNRESLNLVLLFSQLCVKTDIPCFSLVGLQIYSHLDISKNMKTNSLFLDCLALLTK